MFVIAFLPWLGREDAWKTLLNLWGTVLPNWILILGGIAAGVAAFLQYRGSVRLPWGAYFGIAIGGALHSLVFLGFLLADSSFQIGPALAFAAFLVVGFAALGLRPRESKLDEGDRRLKRRRDKRERRTKEGPEPEPGSSDRMVQDPEGEGSSD